MKPSFIAIALLFATLVSTVSAQTVEFQTPPFEPDTIKHDLAAVDIAVQAAVSSDGDVKPIRDAARLAERFYVVTIAADLRHRLSAEQRSACEDAFKHLASAMEILADKTDKELEIAMIQSEHYSSMPDKGEIYGLSCAEIKKLLQDQCRSKIYELTLHKKDTANMIGRLKTFFSLEK